MKVLSISTKQVLLPNIKCIKKTCTGASQEGHKCNLGRLFYGKCKLKLLLKTTI